MTNCNTEMMGSVLYGMKILPPMSVAGVSSIPGADIEQEMRKTLEVPTRIVGSINHRSALGIMELIMASDTKFGAITRALTRELPIGDIFGFMPCFSVPQHKRRRNQTLAYHRRIQKKWNKRWGSL